MAGVIPLCIPNNFYWDSESRKLSKNKYGQRSDVVICPEGRKILDEIYDDPVAVICVAGPARTGKSYILSQMQDDLEFELGHTMTSQTTGIWINENPASIQLSDGTNVRLILIDTEGIGAASSIDDQANSRWDNKIFTLSALISSLLVYNVIGLVTADDLEKLYFISNLCQSIQANAKNSETAFVDFRESAPDFMWLFRDLMLQPTDRDDKPCDLRTYLEQRVLPVAEDEKSKRVDVICKKNKIRKNIRAMFPSFDAFGIPPPSVDPDVIQNISNPKFKHEISKPFLRKVDEFKKILFQKVRPKSLQGMSFLTGNQLAILLDSYVQELNAHGSVPAWRSAWENAFNITHVRAKSNALAVYQNKIQELYKTKEMPHEETTIMRYHCEAQEDGFKAYEKEMEMFNNVTKINEQIGEVLSSFAVFDESAKECIGGELSGIIRKNESDSENFCSKLFHQICADLIDPVLSDLDEMTSNEIFNLLDYVKSKYLKDARGSKVCAIFLRNLPTIQRRLLQARRSIETSVEYQTRLLAEQLARIEAENELVRLEEENGRIKRVRDAREKQFKKEIIYLETKKTKSKNQIENLKSQHRNDIIMLERQIDIQDREYAEYLRRLRDAHQQRIDTYVANSQ